MIEPACTQKRFLGNVENHEMHIVNDDGVNRFVRFRNKERSSYWFDLITWNGCLCISSDCGTFVFSRLEDMFEFFRTDKEYQKKHLGKIIINTGYWEEKLTAVSHRNGTKEYSHKELVINMKQYIKDRWEFDDWAQMREVWKDIKDDLLCYIEGNNEDVALDRVYNYRSDYGHTFEEIWDYGSPTEYTFDYLWCIYAISWGIAQYDKTKKPGAIQSIENKE